MLDDNLKHKIFEIVRQRLIERRESLERFCKHWKGSSSGIEGWFKLEFAAAIGPEVAVVRTGGAGGRGRSGSTYPDLILEFSTGLKIPIETKAGDDTWWFGGSGARQKYSGQILSFLSLTTTPICERHKQQVEALDKDVQLAKICQVQTPKGSRSFYFGMADLDCVALNKEETLAIIKTA